MSDKVREIFEKWMIPNECEKKLVKPDRLYLNMPFQGMPSKETELLIIGNNGSVQWGNDHEGDDANERCAKHPVVKAIVDEIVIKGYSLRYNVYDIVPQSQRFVINEEYFTAYTNPERRKLLFHSNRNINTWQKDALYRDIPYWNVVFRIYNALSKRDISEIIPYSHFVGSELLHVQTRTINEINGSFINTAYETIQKHADDWNALFQLMSEKLRWIVFVGSKGRDFIKYLKNKNDIDGPIKNTIFYTLAHTVRNSIDYLKSENSVNSNIWSVRLPKLPQYNNNRITVLFLPFFLNGQFKKEYYSVLRTLDDHDS